MHALARASGMMNSQKVANAIWALSYLAIQPGAAHACLLPLVAPELSSSEMHQVRYGLEWLQKEGYRGVWRQPSTVWTQVALCGVHHKWSHESPLVCDVICRVVMIFSSKRIAELCFNMFRGSHSGLVVHRTK
jgi:hypothetical protein